MEIKFNSFTAFVFLIMLAKATSGEFTCPQDSGQFPDSVNCRSYYICWLGAPTASDCPNSMMFDVNQALCLNTADVNCASRLAPYENGTIYQCPTPYGLFPSDTSDTDYYYCDNDVPANLTCPGGKVFSAKSNGRCLDEKAAK